MVPRASIAREIAMAPSQSAEDPLAVEVHQLRKCIAELEQRLSISLPDGSLIPEDFETPEVLFNRLQEL